MFTLCISVGTACDKDKPEPGQDTGSADGGDANDGDDDDDSSDDEDGDESGDTEETPHMGECQVGLQDCPNDLKCTGKLRNPDSTYIDDSHCVEVIGDKTLGEECVRNGVDANDDCAPGFFCFAGCTACEGEGICEQFCDNSDHSFEGLSKACQKLGLNEKNYCFNFNDGFFPVCKETCHPLTDTCGEGEGCYPGLEPEFLCSQTKLPEGQDGKDGSACELVQSCLPTLRCVDQERTVGCESKRCCTIFCDLDDPDFKCPEEAESCLPVYEKAQPGKENVGMCALPAE